jgi:murein DD-endopeptidase MepM/ murein hydrolase activator NlpD
MNRRKYTVLVIPSGRGKTHRFTVDSLVLTSFVVFSIVFAAATLYFSYDYMAEQFDKTQLANLEQENELLTDRISGMQGTISDLRDEYAEIIEKEKAIRVMFDLPEIDEAERQLGIGGPELFNWDSGSIAERITYSTELDIDELVRLSTYETQQYKQIYDELISKRAELDHTPSIRPCDGYRTRGYGLMPHPISGDKRFHAGIDIANRPGTPIYTTADGTVEYVGTKGRLGKTIIVDHGNGLKTIYGHLNKYSIKRGTRVRRGDKIGEMGNTGYSTAPHLHYAVTFNGRSVNPSKYIVVEDLVSY